MALSYIISEIKREINQNRDFSYPAFDAPLGGSPFEYCHRLWYGKLEWCGYPKVKKDREYVYSFPHNTQTWRAPDGRTDGHRTTALMHSVARQK